MSQELPPLAPLVEPLPHLSELQTRIGARHTSLPGIGETGQGRLAAARVLIIGAGGLGSPLALYLAAAGIGHLDIIDGDTIEESNLQRQIIHRWQNAGKNKAISAVEQVQALNPSIKATAHPFYLTPHNIENLLASYDLIIDGSDNFATRYLVADTCEILGKPLIWGTLSQYTAQATVFWSAPRYLNSHPRQGWSLRDLYPDMPHPQSVPTCAAGGVLGSLCGTVGSIMATEAIKLITGLPQPLLGTLWLFDARTATTRTLTITPDPNRQPTRNLKTALAEIQRYSSEQDSQQVPSISYEDLRLNRERYQLLDVRSPDERRGGHYEHDQHLPLDQLLAELSKGSTLGELMDNPSELPLVVYCAAGSRSARAVQAILASTPNQKIYSLTGGWKPF
ncbi:ThiF family adenylyltransferase [Rothia sp. P5764]|uniref:ThiF family adenylyltransferase n=1 Tax=Rothia sp. P5764 TaxID=3402654 RepID=UPI003AC0B110